MPIWLARSPTFCFGELNIFEAMAANGEHESGVLGSHPRHTIKRFGNHVIDVV